MNDEKMAFEAMMNEIENSDSDSELDHRSIRVPEKADTKNKRSKHIHPSSHHKQEDEKDEKDEKEQYDVDIDNFGIRNNKNGNNVNVNKVNVINNGNTKAQNKDKNNYQQYDYMTSKKWLLRPCHPHDPVTRCFVIREKSMVAGLTLRVYMEPQQNMGPKFLMSAKKIINKRTSYYLISLLNQPEERGGDDIVGKVRANGVGSKYIITDHGLSPEKTHVPSTLRKEFAFLKFKFDPDTPTGMQVFIPKVNNNGVAVTFQPTSENESIDECVDRKDTSRLLHLVNKMPKWDNNQKGHVLNFDGRVTKSSVKNFQLTVEDDDEICLQFGRVDKDKFTMDVRYPLSLYQAFGICIATMDKKIADRQGYSFVQKLMGGNVGEAKQK